MLQHVHILTNSLKGGSSEPSAFLFERILASTPTTSALPSTVVLTQAHILSQVYAGLVLHTDVVDTFHARIREVASVQYQLRQQLLGENLGTVSGLQPTGKHWNETGTTVANNISLDSCLPQQQQGLASPSGHHGLMHEAQSRGEHTSCCA